MDSNRELKRLKRRRNLFFVSTIIILLISISVICGFVYIFHVQDFSPYISDWGDFGSLLGGIGAILAVAGVLYTLAETKLQNHLQKERFQEEREEDRFKTHLQLYQRQLDNIILNEKSSQDAIRELVTSLRETFKIMLVLSDDRKERSILPVQPSPDPFIRFLKEKTIKFEYIIYQEEFKSEIKEWEQNRKSYINNLDKLLIEFNKEVAEKGWENKIEDLYSEIIKRANKPSSLRKLLYFPFYDMGDLLYSRHGHYLGQYFRAVYYALEDISTCIYSEKYHNIFRSQLSQGELALLFYNAMSTQSTSKTLNYYIHDESNRDIFNNILTQDIIPDLGSYYSTLIYDLIEDKKEIKLREEEEMKIAKEKAKRRKEESGLPPDKVITVKLKPSKESNLTENLN